MEEKIRATFQPNIARKVEEETIKAKLADIEDQLGIYEAILEHFREGEGKGKHKVPLSIEMPQGTATIPVDLWMVAEVAADGLYYERQGLEAELKKYQ